MKATLLFSNINGNILSPDSIKECSFTKSQQYNMKKYIPNNSNLVFINAEGLQNDCNYYKNILNCFEKINIAFDNSIELKLNSEKNILNNFPKENRIYFLMGGNPINQFEVIKKFKLEEILKNTADFVIGFCAGAINLSQVSIITSDDDFNSPLSYKGLGRIPLNIEPHFKLDKTSFTLKRIQEIKNFCKEKNITITALCDKSCLLITDKAIKTYGKTYTFKNN